LFLSLRTSSTPRSSLFPYTTLFRSWMTMETLIPTFILHRSMVYKLLLKQKKVCIPIELKKSLRILFIHFKFGNEQKRFAEKAILDRKSTRLNSSHVKISYAVFCLKK